MQHSSIFNRTYTIFSLEGCAEVALVVVAQFYADIVDGNMRKLPSALEKVKTKDLGEVGDLLTGVVTELKSFDAEEEKGLFGFFKKGKNKIEALKTRYAKVETNVESICKILEGHQVQLLKDIAVMDKMYDANLTYFKELTMYIMAGKKKLEQVRNGELAELVQKAKTSGLPEDVQAAKDLESKCQRFEKKLHDLELTRTISIQTAPQIRLVQGNNTMMVEACGVDTEDRIQSTGHVDGAIQLRFGIDTRLKTDEENAVFHTGNNAEVVGVGDDLL